MPETMRFRCVKRWTAIGGFGWFFNDRWVGHVTEMASFDNTLLWFFLEIRLCS